MVPNPAHTLNKQGKTTYHRPSLTGQPYRGLSQHSRAPFDSWHLTSQKNLTFNKSRKLEGLTTQSQKNLKKSIK
jgi:hypothetical protein